MSTEPTKGNSEYVNKLMEKSKANPGPSSNGFTLFVFAAIAVVFFLLFKSCSDDPSTAQAEEKKDLESVAFIMAQHAVEANLKSPSTAEFPTFDYKIVNPANNLYVVRSYVDSQNGFGAMVRTNFVVTLEYRGGDELDNSNWKVTKVNILE